MPIPETLGHFQLIEEIGHGGMGTVFKALDPTLNRYVAIKVLSEKLSREPEFVENFLREARNAAAISHPHIVQVHLVDENDGQYYIVMELLKGQSLDSLIEQAGTLSEETAMQIGHDVAEALRAAYHTNQMIHGDIKPANIFVDDETGAKVLDFGLAKLANVEATTSGVIWGSPYYLSPERVGRKAEDFRSDIYSLGATLFHALTGRPPFDAATSAELALKRLNERPPLARELQPELTPQTEELLAKMLSKSPLTRYRDYDHLLEQLAEAQHAATAKRLGIEVHTGPPPLTPPDNMPAKKSPWPIVAVVVGALAVAGIAVWFTHRPTVTPPAPIVRPEPPPPPVTNTPPVTVTNTSAPPIVQPQLTPEQIKAIEEAKIREALRQRTAEEIRLIEGGEVEVKALWPKYAFLAVVAHYQAFAAKVETPDGKKFLNQKLSNARQLANFKIQLMSDIAAQPYSRSDFVIGNTTLNSSQITSATDTELILTSSYGETVSPWTDLSPDAMVQLARFYAATFVAAETPAVKDSRAWSLAAFGRQYNVAITPKTTTPTPPAPPKPKEPIKPFHLEMN